MQTTAPEFTASAQGQRPIQSLWVHPFTPDDAHIKGRSIYLVQGGKNQYPAFGDLLASALEISTLRTKTPLLAVGAPVALLAYQGQLTAEGHKYCEDFGVERDAFSLAKWTKHQAPKGFKYEGHETKGRAFEAK